MSIYLTNASQEIINCDAIGSTIIPNETVELINSEQLERASQSSQLITYLANGKIIANDGLRDLNLEEAVHMLAGTMIISGPRDKSGKLRVHQTSRALGTTTCFTGVGDNRDNVSQVGGGQECIFHHSIGDPLVSEYYIDFNIAENESYIHEGYLTWKNCEYDKVTCAIVSEVTSIVPGENTNFSLYGGYLIIPAMGNGNYNLASDITQPRGGLVHLPLDDLGNQPTAYWNADYNKSSHKYENITYAMGDGQYNLFAAEIPMFQMFNKVPLLADGFQELRTSDTAQLGHGMRFKIVTETNGDDHDWGFAFTFVLHRVRSI